MKGHYAHGESIPFILIPFTQVMSEYILQGSIPHYHIDYPTIT